MPNYKTHKTPFPGDSRSIYSYLPSPDGYTPERKLIPGHPPGYGRRYNPLTERLGEQMWECGVVGTEYFTSQGYVAYTQTKDQRANGLFSYYRYDHLFRIIETGIAKPLNVQPGNCAACRKKTNAEMSAEVLSLSERTDVMVVIYNDEDPFPQCPGNIDNHTKIKQAYYYTQIDAGTPFDGAGCYYPDGNYWEITYHYDDAYRVTTLTNQCSLSIVTVGSVPGVSVAENTSALAVITKPVKHETITGKMHPVFTTSILHINPVNPLRYSLLAINHKALTRMGNHAYNAAYSKKRSSASNTARCFTQSTSENTPAIAAYKTAAAQYHSRHSPPKRGNIPYLCNNIKRVKVYLFAQLSSFTTEINLACVCKILQASGITSLPKSILYPGNSPPLSASLTLMYNNGT